MNLPGRQLNAIWGRCPTDRMYDVCQFCFGVDWGARRQNLSRLRVEKLGCAGSRTQVNSAAGLVTPGSVCTPFGSEWHRRKRTASGY
jgi:hypothetical protein